MTTRSCSQWTEAIDRAVDESHVDAELAGHLAGCEACRLEYEALRDALGVLGAGALDDPGPHFVLQVTERLKTRRRPSWLAPVAVLLAGGAGSSLVLGGCLFVAMWLWFGGQRVLATAEYAVADVAGRVLPFADSVLRMGISGFLAPGAVAAALCALLVLVAKGMAGALRSTPPGGSA